MTPSIVIFSGGTMVHVTPHFSLCAPAYGKVGVNLYDRLSVLTRGLPFTITHHQSRMAGGTFETNKDLKSLLTKVLEDPSVKGIVMASAICDFDPTMLTSLDTVVSDFGKTAKRLSSKESYLLRITPADKLVSLIKLKRPDITVMAFKTTSKEILPSLEAKSRARVNDGSADIVLGNDIATYTNIVVSSGDSTYVAKDRKDAISCACSKLVKKVEASVSQPVG